MIRCANCREPMFPGEEHCPMCGAAKPLRWGIIIPLAAAIWAALIIATRAILR